MLHLDNFLQTTTIPETNQHNRNINTIIQKDLQCIFLQQLKKLKLLHKFLVFVYIATLESIIMSSISI